MRRAGLTVVDALAAKMAADAAADRPDETLAEAVQIAVERARFRHPCLLARNAPGDFRWRADRGLRHPVDALDRPVPRLHRKRTPAARRTWRPQLQSARFSRATRDTERIPPIRGHSSSTAAPASARRRRKK